MPVNLNMPVDCVVEVSVARNGSEAFVTVEPPVNGGAEVNIGMIMDSLKANGVVYGIKEDVVKRIANEKRYSERTLVAVWTPAVDGVDGTITYHYEKQLKIAPVEDENGFVDYKDLGLIRTVHKGDVVADITLPTEGTPGTDVKGKILRQRLGKKASYSVGTNTELTEDGLQIKCSSDGNINFRNGAFCVDQVVTISGNVDASVGNIKFVGDVIVKGEVLEGFTISSNSNIIVSGNVNGASLEADGDVIIKKGCINSHVIAHGSVTAEFCEHSTIECDGDLSAISFVICDVYCGGELSTKGNNGGLLGGKYTCLNSITASSIGTKSYTLTQLTVGDNALLAQEKETVLKQIEKSSGELEKITLVINFLNEKKKELHALPEDKEVILGNACRQKVLLGVEINKLRKRIQEIDLSLANRQYLSIDCKGYMYPGVKIVINDAVFKVEAEYVRTRVSLAEDGTIHAMPL